MGKNKLMRFAEMETFENVFQPDIDEVIDKDFLLKGKWNSDFFRNPNPIVLELGCGKGDYTVGLARKYPEKNFIGMDIKGARIWRGAKTAIEESLQNVGFLRMRIEHITSFFAPGEVSEIWITFPDPQVKSIRQKKRLTSSLFLLKYKQFLKTSGLIHLKTDNTLLYEYSHRLCIQNSLEVITATDNLYETEKDQNLLSIQTFYESQFLSQGIPIKYLCFKINEKENIYEPKGSDDE